MAMLIAKLGDMPIELENRAKRYGQPFRAILERAAAMIREGARYDIKSE